MDDGDRLQSPLMAMGRKRRVGTTSLGAGRPASDPLRTATISRELALIRVHRIVLLSIAPALAVWPNIY
ncbi:hypothetical protein EVAR_27989_1 [Eumeta japonica]|uniref:Uncharacterized protein n=1 Tax=Eumeta variegata TaxID=151549 RepID=A0A4C1WC20_EUMVA|nr:hypothetical protein EVAR_27989_1 [Eumeta japonica]